LKALRKEDGRSPYYGLSAPYKSPKYKEEKERYLISLLMVCAKFAAMKAYASLADYFALT
jgi:hypothetical protein